MLERSKFRTREGSDILAETRRFIQVSREDLDRLREMAVAHTIGRGLTPDEINQLAAIRRGSDYGLTDHFGTDFKYLWTNTPTTSNETFSDRNGREGRLEYGRGSRFDGRVTLKIEGSPAQPKPIKAEHQR